MSHPLPEVAPGAPPPAVAGLLERLRTDEAVLGRLCAGIAFKRGLVALLGHDAALPWIARGLGIPDARGVRRRSVVPMLAHARASADYRELWPGGRPHAIEPPRVIGAGDHHRQTGVSRSAWLARLDDVVVRGRSAVLLAADGAALVDAEGNESRQFEDNPEFDPAVLAVDGDGYWTIEAGDDVAVAGEGFLLAGTYAHDFGHWITEHLARLAIALLAGLPRVPLLIDERMPATHRQALQVFLPDWDVRVLPHLAATRVQRLWVAPNPLYRGFSPTNWSDAWRPMLLEPEGFAAAIRELLRRARPLMSTGTGIDKLYLARRPGRKKRLVNHADIEAVAAARGYEIVYPEDHDFATQLRMVHHARKILAPDGSAGLLSYFARPGASVCFMNHTHTLPLVELNGVFGSLGIDFSVVTGPIQGEPQAEPFWSDYSIDPRVLSECLDADDARC